jgi:hypothetical protein
LQIIVSDAIPIAARRHDSGVDSCADPSRTGNLYVISCSSDTISLPHAEGEIRYSGDVATVQAIVRVENLKNLAQQKNVAPSQLALAWVFARGEDIGPIPGTKHRRYV